MSFPPLGQLFVTAAAAQTRATPTKISPNSYPWTIFAIASSVGRYAHNQFIISEMVIFLVVLLIVRHI